MLNKTAISLVALFSFTASSFVLSQEVESTTSAIVSDSDCVVTDQEVSIVGGAVGGTLGGAGGAVVGRMLGGRAGGWIGGLAGSAAGGAVGSKGDKTYECAVVVKSGGEQHLVRSVTKREIKKGESVRLHSLDNGEYHISAPGK